MSSYRTNTSSVALRTISQTPLILESAKLTVRSPSSLSLHSPSAGANDSAHSWQCSYSCGTVYRKSSGRAIRRHMIKCFRTQWPCFAGLADKQIDRMIGEQQDRGLLITGIKQWRLRKGTRSAHELLEHEKWHCPWDCGKYYRNTSSTSIQRHARVCPARAEEISDKIRASESTHSRRNKALGDEDTSTDRESDGSVGSEDNMSLAAYSHGPITSPFLCASATTLDMRSPCNLPSALDDVDHLYPEPPATSQPDMLKERTKAVTLQLQTLIRNVHRRCGTDHPIFSSSMWTPQMLDRLLNEGAEQTDELSADISSGESFDERLVAAPHSYRTKGDASRNAVVSSDAAFVQSMWVCECGESFKVTSSRTMQQHRALCAMHRKHSDSSAQPQSGSHDEQTNFTVQ